MAMAEREKPSRAPAENKVDTNRDVTSGPPPGLSLSAEFLGCEPKLVNLSQGLWKKNGGRVDNRQKKGKMRSIITLSGDVMTVKNSARHSTIVMMILAAAFSRLIPHAPNFTAIGAMALFAGAQLDSKRVAVFVPLMALFLSDLVIGFHDTMLFVYGAVALVALVGRFGWAQWRWKGLAGLSLFSSLLFFGITNFGVWMSGMYASTWQGLVTCYAMAIPFLQTQILGDLFFAGVIFGLFAALQALGRRFQSPA
jgi:hypothetical protein